MSAPGLAVWGRDRPVVDKSHWSDSIRNPRHSLTNTAGRSGFFPNVGLPHRICIMMPGQQGCLLPQHDHGVATSLSGGKRPQCSRQRNGPLKISTS